MSYPNAQRTMIQNERQRLQRQLEDLNKRELQMQQFEQQQAQMYGTQQRQQPTPQNTGNGYVWVDGEQAARAWYVNAGEEVFLMDINVPCFYIKKMDENGKPYPLRIFDYTERTQEPQQTTTQAQEAPQMDLGDKYVTREEYEDLSAKYKELLEKVNNFSSSGAMAETGKQSKFSNARGKGGNADE